MVDSFAPPACHSAAGACRRRFAPLHVILRFHLPPLPPLPTLLLSGGSRQSQPQPTPRFPIDIFFPPPCRWMLENDITDVLDLTFAEGEPGCAQLHNVHVMWTCQRGTASTHLGSEAGAALLASSVVAA